MDRELKLVDAAVVRHEIARRTLTPAILNNQIGEIRLRNDQLEGVSMLMRSIESYGGALLCDAVGSGKTFTALSVMNVFQSGAVIAPAVLRGMWENALKRAGIAAEFYSLEAFSRSQRSISRSDLVIIDEAHHLRNPRTKRFRNIALFSQNSRLLLLSATPIHNHRSDLVSLLSLFLGKRAGQLASNELAECVVRCTKVEQANPSLPKRRIVPPAEAPFDPELMKAIMALPAPVPPRDAGECRALVQFTLLRQWASSDAALRRALEKRVARAGAMISALESGTYPTRQELRSWSSDGPEIQLAFAELLARPGGDRDLLCAVKRHEAATSKLLRKLRRATQGDRWRAAYLYSISKQYESRKVVAFTQFTATAQSLFSILRHENHVGMVTSSSCEIASGRVTRRDVLERFAPNGSRARSPGVRDQITLLIATDLCSEGLNLQDASVVVHLDMPWTVARLEQRVGRVARAGSKYGEIFVHSLRAPQLAEQLLRIQGRLRAKGYLADAVIGSSEATGGFDFERKPGLSVPEASSGIRNALAEWASKASESTHSGEDHVPLLGYVKSRVPGFLALLGCEGTVVLICDSRGGASADPREILARIHRLENYTAGADPVMTEEVVRQIDSWIGQHYLEKSLLPAIGDAARSNVLRRIQREIRCAPGHTRPEIAPLLEEARSALTGRMRHSGEIRLEEIASAEGDNGRWVRDVSLLGSCPAEKRRAGAAGASGLELIALLIGV